MGDLSSLITSLGLAILPGVLISLIVILIDVIATWRVFKRMGLDPVYAIIPVAKEYTMFKGTTGMPGLLFVLWLISSLAFCVYIPMCYGLIVSSALTGESINPIFIILGVILCLIAVMPIVISRLCLPIVFGQSWVLGLLSFLFYPLYWVICFGKNEYKGVGRKDVYEEYDKAVSGEGVEIPQEVIAKNKKETPEERKARREAEKQQKLEEKKRLAEEKRQKMEEKKQARANAKSSKEKSSKPEKKQPIKKTNPKDAKALLESIDNMSDEEFMASLDDSDYMKSKGNKKEEKKPTKPVKQEKPVEQEVIKEQVEEVRPVINEGASINDDLDFLDSIIK